MKISSVIIIIGSFFVGDCGCLIAQDAIYSQFYNAPLQLNPAFAGKSYAPSFAINYRNQLPFFDAQLKTFSTYSLSYDQFFSKLNSGIGVFITGDDAGDGLIKTNKASLLYSYRVRLTKDLYVRGAIELGLISIRYNWDKFLFFDQLDPISPGGTPLPTEEVMPDKTSKLLLDASFGALIYSSKYYAGVSWKHLNHPNINILNIRDNQNSFVGLPLRWGVHFGGEWTIDNNISKKTFISPNVLFVKQGPFMQMNVGAYMGFSTFFAGMWYRHTFSNADAAIISVGASTGGVKLSYSFDYTISSLGIGNGGSHEFGMLINLDNVVEKPSKYNDCFELFR